MSQSLKPTLKNHTIKNNTRTHRLFNKTALDMIQRVGSGQPWKWIFIATMIMAVLWVQNELKGGVSQQII